MKKVVFAITFGVLCSAGSVAQGRMDLTNYFNTTKAGVGSLMEKVGKKETENATGSQYLVSSFTLGSISNVDEALLVKYNAYSDEMELDNGNNKVFILPKDEEFSTVTLKAGTVYRLVNYKDGGKDVRGYLVEKTNTNGVSLLKREKVVLIPERQPQNGYGNYVPPKFEKGSDEYYILLKDKSVVEFPKNKKKLTALFKDKKSEIDSFFKTNNASFKSEQDMIAITNFIATL